MSQRKIRLIVNCPNSKDATSFYRGIGPIAELAKTYPGLELHFAGEYNWATLALGDIVFMQRPYKESDVTIIKMCKANRKPVWVDYDDDLFNVPISNPAHDLYSSKQTRANIASCIAYADEVTVSVDYLKRQFQGGACKDDKPITLNKSITVVPNAINDRLLSYRKPPGEEREKFIMWRGSRTHHEDLFDYLREIADVTNSNPEWTFMFHGDKPWFLYRSLKDNAIFAPPLDPLEYFDMIHRTKPRAFIVPLSDHTFNRSKSNIAWLEAVFAGGVAIAPDWEEWRVPGCLNYRNPSEFKELLTASMDMPTGQLNALNATAWRYVQENLLLSKVNKLRAEVLNRLVEKIT